MAEQHERLQAVVRGVVQGVNFRYVTQERAQSFGLTGWVRNRYDGSVEVVAEGRREMLDRLLDFLHHGPPAASVDEVQASWSAAGGGFSRFEIRW